MQRWASTLLSLIGIAIVLKAWSSLALAIDGRVPDSIDEHQAVVLSAACGAIVSLLLRTVGARVAPLRRPLSWALLASVILLPFFHYASVDWLSTLVRGGGGDFVELVGPWNFYGAAFSRAHPLASGVASLLLFAGLVVAAAVACRRPRSNRALTVLGLAAIALVVLAAGVGSVTRPPVERWSEAMPVLARVPFARVPISMPRALHEPATATWVSLPRGISVARFERCFRMCDSCLGGVDWPWVLLVRSPAITDGEGELGRRFVMGPDCALGSEVVLQALPRAPGVQLSCSNGADAPHVVVPSPWFRVRRMHALGIAAPPRAWTILGAVGLLISVGILARRRPAQPGPDTVLHHPYRPQMPPDAPSLLDVEFFLRSAGALAFAAHAAAPLVLSAWIRFLDRWQP